MSLNGPPSGCATCVKSCEAATVTTGWGLSLPPRSILIEKKDVPSTGPAGSLWPLLHHVNDRSIRSML